MYAYMYIYKYKRAHTTCTQYNTQPLSLKHTYTKKRTLPSLAYPCKLQQARTAQIQSATTTVTLGERLECVWQ